MKQLLVGLSFSIMASTAFAADAFVDAAPVFSWTGGYVGVQGGYTLTDSSLRNVSELNLVASPQVDSLSLGGFIGYRYQFTNNIVAGIEADGNWLSGSASDQWFNTDISANYPDSPVLHSKWDASARLTLGYAMDRWLPYVTGGVAFLNYDINVLPIAYNNQLRSGGTETGWTAGAGVAYAFTDSLIGHVDYRYADFGTRRTDFTDSFFGEDALKTHKITFGIAYKF